MGLKTEKAPVIKDLVKFKLIADTPSVIASVCELITRQRDADHEYYLAKIREVVEGACFRHQF